MQSISGNFHKQILMAERVGYGRYGPNFERRPGTSIEVSNAIVVAVVLPVLALFVHFSHEMARNGQLLIEYQRTTRRSRSALSLFRSCAVSCTWAVVETAQANSNNLKRSV